MMAAEELTRHTHVRSLSESSASSRASSDSQDSTISSCKVQPFSPLFSHPPLSLNASPSLPDDQEVAWRQGVGRESSRIPDEEPVSSAPAYTHTKSHSYSGRNPSEREYFYDQGAQWPLKDWQTIPPGLVEASYFDLMGSSSSSEDEVIATPLRPRPAKHQRAMTEPTLELVESDLVVKRGAWKRRGIVFQMDPEAAADEERHFELPLVV
jgi:hypothetical protein